MGKKYVIYSLLLFMVFIFVSSGAGQSLTDIQLQDLPGNPVHSTDFLGQYVIFDIFATWCPPCVVAMKDYQSNLDAFAQEGIHLVAISVDDSLATLTAFLEEHGITFPVLHDPQHAVNQWQVRALPTMIIVAPDGSILLRKEGYGSFEQFWHQASTVVNEHRESSLSTVYEDKRVVERLPEIQVEDLQGEVLSSSHFYGAFVFFDIFATWCPPCVVAMTDYQAHLDSFREEGIEIVAISVDDDLAYLHSFIEEHAIEFLVLHDSRMAVSRWGVQYLPTIFFTAPTGEVIIEEIGYVSFDVLWEKILQARDAYISREGL